MEENVKDIEQKQNYLINEIMNQNYDPEKFSYYISNLKENGTDLNNWTLEELKEIVISFKKQEDAGTNNNQENIEKEVENVRNSFILSKSDTKENINNPYNQIFDDKEDAFMNVENIMSDLVNEDEETDKKKKNNLWSGVGDFEIIESSEFIDSSTDKLKCIKQKENSLSKYNDLRVNITG